MKIVDFDRDPNLLQKFLDFPKILYASDSNWIPDSAETHLLTRPQSADTHWKNFIAFKGDEICGRLTAIINAHVCDKNNQPFGQLGFFECINDIVAANALINAGIQWLSQNLPAHSKILAPMNFDTWHSYRLRTNGFDESTFFMEPYNPAYYPHIFINLGFQPVAQYLTKTVNKLSPLLEYWEPYHHEMRAKGFSIRSFNLATVPQELNLIYQLSIKMFRENLFFTEISESEFQALYKGTTGNLDPDLFLFLLDSSNQPIGLCFNLADHRHPHTINVKTFGVLPEFRHEGIGAGFAYEIYQRFQEKGFTKVNHCLMRAGNRADAFDGGLGKITREYTLFTRSISI